MITDETAPPEQPHGLELIGLVKRYGNVEAVRGIDLTVRSGEFLTILGPSGSGKTTVLRLIAGFTETTEGAIRLAGRDVSEMTPAERGIGMVFQNYALFPHLTAIDNVAYGLKMRGMPRAQRREKAGQMLALVGLEGMEKRLPKELSGGQQQRVALARALAFDPALLLMDEPLGALDRELRIRMAGELRRIHGEMRTTVLYVTHDREEALTLSDRIAIMQRGIVEAVDTPENLYTRPGSSFVASFFGGHNLLPGRVLDLPDPATGSVEVECLDQRATVSSGAPLHKGQQILLSVPCQAIGIEPSSRSLAMDVTVLESLYMGETTQVMCVPRTLPDAVSVRAELPGHHVHGLAPDVSTTLYIDTGRIVAVPANGEQGQPQTSFQSEGDSQ